MPSWSESQAEFARFPPQPNGLPDFDGYRRFRYRALAEHTGRPCIVFATDFLNKPKIQAAGGDVAIDLADRDGVREVTHNLTAKAIDLIIQSPGGSPEAADTIVQVLRRRFEHVRIIVPGIAKSAATMIALSAHELVMEADAELGPIDPQMGVRRGDTTVWAPAQAIIDQFEEAQKLLGSEPARLAAWIPILQQYGPALFRECQNAIVLSKRYARDWLASGMLKTESAARRKKLAKKVVDYLGSHNRFKTHGARVGFEELHALGLPVKRLNDDAVLCERVMAVYMAVMHTFDSTGAFRVWENSEGASLLRVVQTVPVVVPARPRPGPPSPPSAPVTPPATAP